MTQSELNHGTEQVLTPTRDPLNREVSATLMSDGMQLTPSVANTNMTIPVEQTLSSVHSPPKERRKIVNGLSSSGIDQKENQYGQIPHQFQQTLDKQSLHCSLHPSQAGIWTEEKLGNFEITRANDLKSLAESIHNTIMKDEMANTYKLSNVTQEFFKDRVIEVILESLASEKEAKIQTLLHQLNAQQRDFNQSSSTALEIERLRKRCTQIPVLQSKIEDLDQKLTATYQNHEAELMDRQADIEYRQEQHRLLKERLEKTEKQSSVKTLALQEMESQVNQLKRICESLTQDKDMLERRIQDQLEDLEQDGVHQQNLKQESLETQFQLKQAIQENDALKKRVKALEIEKKDIVGKFDEFGERLGEQMNTQHLQAISQLNQTHQDQTSVLEKQIQDFQMREAQLQEEIETARELQVAIAQRMKDDIRAVRDEWAGMLAEKEVEMKKIEASEALRIKSSKSELQAIHQAQVQEIQAANAQNLLKLKTEYELKLRDLDMKVGQSDQQIQEMIKITEHEHILNSELNKANNLAQSQLEQLQKTLEQQFMQTIQERVKECEAEYQKQLNELKETLTQVNKQQLDRQTQENNWKLRQIGQETQYKIQDQAQQHQLQLEEALAQISKLQQENEKLIETEQSQANQIVELKQAQCDKVTESQTTIHKLENQLKDSQREIQMIERQRKTLQTKLQNYKERTKVIVSTIQDKVSCTVSNLRQELLETRSELHHTQDESCQIVKEVRTLVNQVNQKLSCQMEELVIDKEQLEDALDTLRDRLRTSEGRTQRVVNEKRQNIEIVKSDFQQVIEVAKQEVQRKYCFELKQLKRCILHLKDKLSEELDNKQREIDQIQSLFKQERSQLETEIRIAYQRVNEMRAYGIRSNVSHQTKVPSTIVSSQSTSHLTQQH